ncbi:MAG: hypothetical protein JXA28_03635 [Bacteroidetes bacterium]|nr:hypothetical protein [Bacteroidota bacterium]
MILNGFRFISFLLLVIACVSAGARAQFASEGDHAPQLRVGDQLIVNYFEADPDVFETHLVITDHEGSGSVVNVLLHDMDGNLVAEQSYFLPIFGKINYNPAESLGGKKFKGTIRIYSDGGNVSAQYWQFYRDPLRSAYNTAIPASDAHGSKALLCQHFVSAPGIEARLVLVNPASDSAVTVSVTFYLDRGKQLTRDRHVIPPNGMKVLDPHTENEGLIKTGLAYCEVVGEGAITGEYWQASPGEDYQVSLPLDIIPVRKKHW